MVANNTAKRTRRDVMEWSFYDAGYNLLQKQKLMNATTSIVSKVWSFCTTLRDDGVGYGDYLEQLTYLIFLKMANEYSQPPYNRKMGIPAEYDWQNLRTKRGSELEVHYMTLLRELGNKPGMLRQIFTKAQPQIQLSDL